MTWLKNAQGILSKVPTHLADVYESNNGISAITESLTLLKEVRGNFCRLWECRRVVFNFARQV